MKSDVQICQRCLMDTTDPDIQFFDDGTCNHCRDFLRQRNRQPTGSERTRQFDELVTSIREAGKNKDYDCIVGVSGGVDSTYVAYVAKEAGLRPLAVHLDNGWNSELAVNNIENTLTKLGIDLHTHVLDWQTFRRLQRSFLEASVTDAEIPTDHAIRAALWGAAQKHGVKYLLHGRNHTTEGILPWSWSYSALDWKYISSVHATFSSTSLARYPHVSLPRLVWGSAVHRLKNIGILDYVDFDKSKAMQVLQDKLGWRDYGGKHYESIYTRFFQGSILPRKFGIDKRKAHLSVLICTGQISRQEGLDILSTPPLPPDMEKEDKEFVLDKLEITDQEFEDIMNASIKTYRDYPNNSWVFLMHENPRMVKLLKVMRALGVLPRGFGEGVLATQQARET